MQIAFPTGAHLYEGDSGKFSVKKPPIALLSGPPLNASDPFKAILYVGDLAQPGTKTLTVKCIGKVNDKGPLKTLFTGPLKTEYVRQDAKLSPKGSIFSMNLLDLFGTEPPTGVGDRPLLLGAGDALDHPLFARLGGKANRPT